MRLNFELPEERVKELKELQTETASDSMKELFNNALTMLAWAIKEVKNGNEIAAVNDKEDIYRVFVTPLLERVVRKSQSAPALTSAASAR